MTETNNRLFLAFAAQQLAPELTLLQNRLALPGRRVSPEQFHMTLHFMGQCTPEQQTSLLAQIDRLTLPAFALTLDRLGCFAKAGVIWLGPSAPPDSLMKLYETIELKCRALGAGKPHRAYRPHITLFRNCTSEALPPIAPLHYRPDSLCLYRSELTAQGPVYHCQKRWPLKRE